QAPAASVPAEPGPVPRSTKAADRESHGERPADASMVRTVTLADLYWAQGEREVARKIVGRILRDNPHDERALAWMAAHGKEEPLETALKTFLEKTAKEYGYDLSGNH
ncbi:MAG: hypothetical protein ACM3L8_08070, partial [Verrucomicrobiota bacterium]